MRLLGWFLLPMALCCLAGEGEPKRGAFTVPFTRETPQLAWFTGMKPNNAAANAMAEVHQFIQRTPRDGEAATFPTRTFLAYDDKHLYVVFLAFDSEPDKIRARMVPREQIFGEDAVNIMIDTFNNRQRAYVFLASASGVQSDAVWTESEEFDFSFNTVWYTQSQLTDQGFMVMMTIPFKSMRFNPGSEQTWAVMFNREVPRTGECSYWPVYSSRIQGRLNQAGLMTIPATIDSGKNRQIIPFATFRSFELLDPQIPEMISDDSDPDGGLDAKFIFQDKYVLDVAVNPDFSQVESDEPQIITNERFELFFPERRPFFLENSDIFKTPLRMVFTRRIADPSGGVRLTGRNGDYSFGGLLMNDESAGKVVDPDHPGYGEDAYFGIARVTRDILDQSKVGFLYTGRQFESEDNHVVGIDGRFKLNETWVVTGQALHSTTQEDGHTSEGHLATVYLDRNERTFHTHNHYTETAEDFRTQVGFLGQDERLGTRNFHTFSQLRFFPETVRVTNYGPDVFYTQTWSMGGTSLDRRISPSFQLQLPATHFRWSYAWDWETVTPLDYGLLNHNLDFSFKSWTFNFDTKAWSKVTTALTLNQGTRPNYVPLDGIPTMAENFFGELRVDFHLFDRLRVFNTFLYSDLNTRDDQSIFSIRILRSSWNLQFSREFSARLIAQYNDREANPETTFVSSANNLNADLLFTYQVNAWTALYVGYATNYGNNQLVDGELINDPDHLNRDARQVFLKFSYLLR